MIVALWLRWRRDRRALYLAAALGVLALDAVVGSWLLAWEIELLREWLP